MKASSGALGKWGREVIRQKTHLLGFDAIFLILSLYAPAISFTFKYNAEWGKENVRVC